MQKFKRITSAALGTLMTGASLLAPAFADLSTFGTWTPANTLVVVGADADAVDIVGGMNIAAAVAQHGASGKSGSTSVAGAETEDIALGSLLTAFGTLKDNKLAGFQDGKIDWNDEEVDYEETLNVNGVEVLVSQTDDADLEEEVVLGTQATAIEYRYEISDSDFNTSAVTDDDALYVDFLGTSLKIVDLGTNQMTYEAGTKVTLGVGDSVKVGSDTLTVKTIGDGKATIDVNGQTEIVDEADSSEEIGTTDVKVTVEDILYTDDVESRQIQMLVGSETTETVQDGDSAELFGEPEKKNDATWVWEIVSVADADGETTLTLGMFHNQVWTDAEDPVLAVGESWSLPNEYATINFDGLTAEADVTYTVSFEEDVQIEADASATDLPATVRFDAVKIVSSDADGIQVMPTSGSEETDVVYLYYNSTAGNIFGAFENDDGDVQMFTAALGNSSSATFYLIPGDNNHTVTFATNTYTAASTDATLTVDSFGQTGGAGDLVVDNIDIIGQKLGATDEEAEAADVALNGTSIGTRDESVRTIFGNVVENPEDNNDADEVVFRMTGETEGVEATVTISGPEGATTTVGSGNVNFVSLGNGIAATTADVDASEKTEKNLILVGGPYANDLVNELAEAGKTATRAEWDAMTGQAIVQYVAGGFADDQDVIIVAGYAAADTRAAALALATEPLTGTGQSWMGSTQEDYTYEAPVAEEDAVEEAAADETATE